MVAIDVGDDGVGDRHRVTKFYAIARYELPATSGPSTDGTATRLA